MALYTSILTGGTNNHTTTSEEANSLATDFISNGIIGTIGNTNSVAPMTGGFAVNAQGTPDMTVAVTAGAAYVAGTPSGQGSQEFRVRLSANENVTISANSSGSTKYDWVYIKIDPTAAANPNLAGDDVSSLVVSRSTSNSADNGTPPTYGYLIAVVTVANGASSITNGSIRDVRVRSEITANSSAVSTGWVTGTLPAISNVVANGNRSYTLTHASSIASVVSAGMRRRFTRTVAANTYMGGAFNGSSHYFTKTTPSGTLGTVTNNFTIEACYQPDLYPAARDYIGGRSDSTPNNAFGMFVEPSGQVGVAVFNAGVANYRSVITYQSLPLNKKTHIAASWTGGTVVIYFDGISVPVAAAVTGGTAPTTAGTGGDFSIGRLGAFNNSYASGYISNVAVFDAVLSATTIKNHSTIKLLGSETNCIGAWALDNAATDQSSAGNNLTATGGVGYTNISPFGNGGISSTLEYGLTMSVSSDGLTEVVQCPEGCALPDGSSTITASAYSSMANPYGWVSDKGRWQVASITRAFTLFTPTSGTAYNYSSVQLSIPIGSWVVEHRETMRIGVSSGGGNYANGASWLATTAASATGLLEDSYNVLNHDFGTGPDVMTNSLYCNPIPLSVAAATTYYLNWSLVSGGTIYANQCGYSSTTPTTVRISPSGL